MIFQIVYNILRFIANKFKYGNRYSSKLIERISPSTCIKLYKKGRINLGYNINLDKYVDIQIHGNGNLKIGDRTYMNRYCIISCHNNISIGKNCMFGPSVYIFDNNHKFAKDKGVSHELLTGEITIGDNCWLASSVIILKGAKIGNNCVIGAGCIINYEVPDNTIITLKQDQNIKEIYK